MPKKISFAFNTMTTTATMATVSLSAAAAVSGRWDLSFIYNNIGKYVRSAFESHWPRRPSNISFHFIS